MERDTRDKVADTVGEFCLRVGISRRGEGSATVTLGHRRLIRREAGETWLRDRERAGRPSC